MIDTYKMALFIGNKQLKMSAAEMINLLEEQMWVKLD